MRWARHQFNGFTGADQQHRLLGQARENPLGQVHPGIPDRHGIGADGGVGAHLLGHRKGVLKKPVEHLAGGADIDRRVKRIFHLPKYLRFAKHHRIEAGRDPEGMLDRLFVRENDKHCPPDPSG